MLFQSTHLIQFSPPSEWQSTDSLPSEAGGGKKSNMDPHLCVQAWGLLAMNVCLIVRARCSVWEQALVEWKALLCRLWESGSPPVREWPGLGRLDASLENTDKGYPPSLNLGFMMGCGGTWTSSLVNTWESHYSRQCEVLLSGSLEHAGRVFEAEPNAQPFPPSNPCGFLLQCERTLVLFTMWIWKCAVDWRAPVSATEQ